MDILGLIGYTKNKVKVNAVFNNLTYKEVRNHYFLDDKLSHPIEIQTYAGFEFNFKVKPLFKRIGITGKGRAKSIFKISELYKWGEGEIFPLNLDVSTFEGVVRAENRYKSAPISATYDIDGSLDHEMLCDISETIKREFDTNPRLVLSYNGLDIDDLKSIRYSPKKVASYSMTYE